MIDRYTKCVLTVIAGLLLAIAIQLSIPPASARFDVQCGASISLPCYVKTAPFDYLNVKIDR